MSKMLNVLNSLRTTKGQKELKAWKGSKAALEAAILKLDPDYSLDLAREGVVVTKVAPTAPELNSTAKREVRITKAVNSLKAKNERVGKSIQAVVAKVNELEKKVAKSKVRLTPKVTKSARVVMKGTNQSQVPGDMVSIVELARKHGVNPKVARQRMRKTDFAQNRTDGRHHSFPAKLEAAIVEIITGRA